MEKFISSAIQFAYGRGRPLNAPAAETGALHGQKAKGEEN
jgi:hypothetical protein